MAARAVFIGTTLKRNVVKLGRTDGLAEIVGNIVMPAATQLVGLNMHDQKRRGPQPAVS